MNDYERKYQKWAAENPDLCSPEEIIDRMKPGLVVMPGTLKELQDTLVRSLTAENIPQLLGGQFHHYELLTDQQYIVGNKLLKDTTIVRQAIDWWLQAPYCRVGSVKYLTTPEYLPPVEQTSKYLATWQALRKQISNESRLVSLALEYLEPYNPSCDCCNSELLRLHTPRIPTTSKMLKMPKAVKVASKSIADSLLSWH